MDNPPEIPISPKCCLYGKKDVLHKALSEGEYDLNITGMRKAEGGARSTIYHTCFIENEGGTDMYMPIWWYTGQTKEIYREHYGVTRSECYTKYGLKRTGCAGCPYGQKFEEELEIMQKYEPNLFKAANSIFGESYRYTRKYKMYATFMEYLSKGST